jgi:hypothetical protein
MIKRSHLFSLFAALLCAVVERTSGERACLQELCLECNDCATMTPAYTYNKLEKIPSVGDIRQACSCTGCPNADFECKAVHAKTGIQVPDSTQIEVVEQGPNGSIDLTESIIKSNLSGFLLSYSCPPGCNNIQYSPGILGDMISVRDLKRGCVCTACPQAQVDSCLFYRDGRELDSDDLISSLYAFTARQIVDAASSNSHGANPPATVFGTLFALMAILT